MRKYSVNDLMAVAPSGINTAARHSPHTSESDTFAIVIQTLGRLAVTGYSIGVLLWAEFVEVLVHVTVRDIIHAVHRHIIYSEHSLCTTNAFIPSDPITLLPSISSNTPSLKVRHYTKTRHNNHLHC